MFDGNELKLLPNPPNLPENVEEVSEEEKDDDNEDEAEAAAPKPNEFPVVPLPNIFPPGLDTAPNPVPLLLTLFPLLSLSTVFKLLVVPKPAPKLATFVFPLTSPFDLLPKSELSKPVLLSSSKLLKFVEVSLFPNNDPLVLPHPDILTHQSRFLVGKHILIKKSGLLLAAWEHQDKIKKWKPETR